MPNTQIIIIIFTSYTKKRLTSLYVLFSVQLIRDDYPLQMKLEHFQLHISVCIRYSLKVVFVLI